MKVSLITATWNSARTIKDCIHSVNNQDYNEIEHIFIDGGSYDATIDIINSTSKRKAKIISEKDNGIYDAMNKGVKHATGDIIGIINSDDLYSNEKVISSIIDVFKKKEEVECVFADLYYVNQFDIQTKLRYWRTGKYIKGSFKQGWHPAHPTLFVRRHVYQKYGMFNLKYKLAADFEFMLRIFEVHHIKSFYLPKPIVLMRRGGATSNNIVNIYRQNVEILNAFKEHHINVTMLYTIRRIFSKVKQYRKIN